MSVNYGRTYVSKRHLIGQSHTQGIVCIIWLARKIFVSRQPDNEQHLVGATARQPDNQQHLVGAHARQPDNSRYMGQSLWNLKTTVRLIQEMTRILPKSTFTANTLSQRTFFAHCREPRRVEIKVFGG